MLDRHHDARMRGGGIWWWHGWTRQRGRRKRGPTGGAHMTVIGERKGATVERHKPEEKTHFSECAKVSRVD
jgi:hypothetical protein